MQAPASATAESHVRAAIAQLIEEDSQLGDHEKRHELRYPFFQPVTIVSENGNHSISGLTRQISPSGIGLLHCAPLGSSDATVTMHNALGYAVTLVVENIWCHSCGPHWYVSGGRFVDLATNDNTPAVADNDEADGNQGAANQDAMLLDEIMTSVRQTIDGVVDKPTYGSAYANRRSEERYYATLPVTATFEDKSRSIRDSIRTVTRDISRNGIALISDQPITAKLLSLEITDRNGQKTLTALMQLLRCRPIGHLYELAGRFVTKVFSD